MVTRGVYRGIEVVVTRTYIGSMRRELNPYIPPISLDLACPLNPQHILHACKYSEYSRRVDYAL